MALVSSKFQNVADEAISAGDSASFIISQMIAFGIEAENAESIIDSLNEVSNQYSVSSGDLSKALGIVASTSSAMGNSMEETLGIVTAITEQTRNSTKAARGKWLPKCIVICTICIYLNPVNPKALSLQRSLERLTSVNVRKC